MDATWFGVERQRYFETYMNALNKLYAYFMAQKNMEKALQFNKLIIHNDPSNEDAFCNAMSIYYSMGNTAAIIRVYEQCKQQLAREYGLEPSENTTRYFQSLVQPKS